MKFLEAICILIPVAVVWYLVQTAPKRRRVKLMREDGSPPTTPFAACGKRRSTLWVPVLIVLVIYLVNQRYFSPPSREFVSWVRQNKASLIASRDPERTSLALEDPDRRYFYLTKPGMAKLEKRSPQLVDAWVTEKEGEPPMLMMRALGRYLVLPEALAAEKYPRLKVVRRQEGYVVLADPR